MNSFFFSGNIKVAFGKLSRYFGQFLYYLPSEDIGYRKNDNLDTLKTSLVLVFVLYLYNLVYFKTSLVLVFALYLYNLVYFKTSLVLVFALYLYNLV